MMCTDYFRPALIRANGGSPSRQNGSSPAFPLQPAGSGSGTTTPAPTGALSIFAPPVSADLPEALQGVISPPVASSSRQPETALNGNVSASTSTNGHSGGRELRVRLTIPTTANGNGNGTGEGDSMIKDAADGIASTSASASTRLRPTRGKEGTQRTGVSASGKGVKVGGGARVGVTGPPTLTTRNKGAKTSEVVSCVI